MDLIRVHKPLHMSIVGGEPLVRYRELQAILPQLAQMGIYTQLVTSAVRPIPAAWAELRRLQIVVSIDGLQPEHDVRRTPATYERILKHIEGHQITVHCTVTKQQTRRPGYIEEFIHLWSAQPTVRTVWISLYTPQIGEISEERLTAADRTRVVTDLLRLRVQYPKLQMPKGLIDALANPPASPAECVFARTTTCLSADFTTDIAPCQFGGRPDCANCGCIASAGLAAVARHRLGGRVRVGAIFERSLKIGDTRSSDACPQSAIISRFMRLLRKAGRKVRSVRKFVRGLIDTEHPLLVHHHPYPTLQHRLRLLQRVPIRRLRRSRSTRWSGASRSSRRSARRSWR